MGISSTPVALLVERELILYLNFSCWIICQIRWALLVVGCLSCRLSNLSVPFIQFSIPFYVLSFLTFLLLNALLFSRKCARLLAAAHLHASTVVSSSKVNCPTQGRPVPSILLILCRMIHGEDIKPSGCSALVEYCYPRHQLNGTQNCLEFHSPNGSWNYVYSLVVFMPNITSNHAINTYTNTTIYGK